MLFAQLFTDLGLPVTPELDELRQYAMRTAMKDVQLERKSDEMPKEKTLKEETKNNSTSEAQSKGRVIARVFPHVTGRGQSSVELKFLRAYETSRGLTRIHH